MSVQDKNVQGAKPKISKFLREVKAEIKKVTWPNKRELQSYTGIVFITVAVVALALWAMDSVLNKFVVMIIR